MTWFMVIALVFFAMLAWLCPRIALRVVLASLPFYEITRFTVARIPFTFPEAAVYVLAGVLILRTCTIIRCHCERAEGERGNLVPRTYAAGEIASSGRWSSALLAMTKKVFSPWIALSFLWFLIATISAVYSPAGARAWGIWRAYFLAPVLLFWIIRYLFQRPPEISSFRGSRATEKSHTIVLPSNNVRSLAPTGMSGLGMTSGVVLPLAAGAFIVAAIAIMQRWWPVGVPYPWLLPGQFRATSVFGYPNAIGLFLAPLVPLFMGAACMIWSSFRASSEESHTNERANNNVRSLDSSRLKRRDSLGMTLRVTFYFLLFTSPLALIAILLAKSTGAFIALAMAAIVGAMFAVWRPRIQRPRAWAIGITLAWVLASVAITGVLPYKRDTERIRNPIVRKLAFGSWSGSVRLEQYRETWAMLRDHPIRGAGLAGYKQAFVSYHRSAVEIFPYPHNLLLAMWSELGLAGVLVFLAILYQFSRKLFSPPPDRRGGERGWRCGIALAMLVVLVHGLVDVPYFKNDLSMVFWIIVALGSLGKMPNRPV